MYRVAWWTCALLSVASARIYGRCELTRDLQDMGVQREHISTWICIAYHESRFDTAARNPYSGDHGLFQISELYWCGPGKACGLPCSDLRDEDISDDLRCALQVHEEHTRLQGDGFLAWVVYPQHCKQNTKKYIIDCDNQIKNMPPRIASRPRTLTSYDLNSTSIANTYNSNIDNLKPPYLTINSIIRDAKSFQGSDRKSSQVNWLNFKVDKIDELRLPVFNTRTEKNIMPNPSSTSAPTTTSIITPSTHKWRKTYVETNQFRNRIFNDNKIPSYGKAIDVHKPSSSVVNNFIPQVFTTSPGTEFTSYSAPSRSFAYTASTRKPATSKYTEATTTKPTTYKPTMGRTTTSWIFNSSKNTGLGSFTKKPTYTTTTTTTTKKLNVTNHFDTSFTSMTKNPHPSDFKSFAFGTKLTEPQRQFAGSKTTAKPNTLVTSSIRSVSSTNSYTSLPFSRLSNHIAQSLPTTTQMPVTRHGRLLKTSERSSSSLTSKQSLYNTTVTPAPIENATKNIPVTKTTQSIFDLYLNPTRETKLRSYNFSQHNNGAFKLKIFSDGTTTLAPKATPSFQSAAGGAARNYVRRQALQT